MATPFVAHLHSCSLKTCLPRSHKCSTNSGKCTPDLLMPWRFVVASVCVYVCVRACTCGAYVCVFVHVCACMCACSSSIVVLLVVAVFNTICTCRKQGVELCWMGLSRWLRC